LAFVFFKLVYNSTYSWCDTPDIIIWNYTIAACNVWATTAWVHTWCTVAWNDNINLLTTNVNCGPEYVWYHFQWWRNKWFSMLTAVTSPRQSTKIDWTVWLNAISDAYQFVRSSLLTSYTWASTDIDNNWWWKSDNTTAIWNNKNRQWPCKNWYHVPSTAEWRWLVAEWFASKWVTTCNDSGNPYFCIWTWDATLDNFQSDLKLPLAGARDWSNGNLNFQGSFGYYWSSSPSGIYAWSLDFNPSNIYPANNAYHADGFSIRCFKN
jgi:hypothetical protein